MGNFLGTSIVPGLTNFVSNLAGELNTTRIGSQTLDPAHSEQGEAAKAIRNLSKALSDNEITDVRKLGIIAGVGNLLRSAAQRILVQQELESLVKTGDIEIELQPEQTNPDLEPLCCANQKISLLGIGQKTKEPHSIIYVDKDKLVNDDQLVVRGVDARSNFWREPLIGTTAQWLENFCVPVNCSFNANEITGLKSFINSVKSQAC